MRRLCKMLAIAGLAGLFTTVVAPAAVAQRTALSAGCRGDKDNDAVIAACTRFIARGNQVSSQELARAYSQRARAYSFKGDHDQALRDIDEAIRVEPNSSLHYAHRADFLVGKGDYESAILNYDQAMRVDFRRTICRRSTQTPRSSPIPDG